MAYTARTTTIGKTVGTALDIAKRPSLLECLTLPTNSPKWGERLDNPDGELFFRDNGASVLAVGHLDYVMWRKPLKRHKIVWCPQLDDRLGVWVLLNLLPNMGVNVDVLLTDLEESGRTTAQHFKPAKEYNWIVEFDRRGTDVVMYQYECDEYEAILGGYGFKCGWGSFSDICELGHLDVAGFNFGTGYYHEHTTKCSANIQETKEQASKFQQFYNDYKDTKLLAPEIEDMWQYVHQPTSFLGGYTKHQYARQNLLTSDKDVSISQRTDKPKESQELNEPNEQNEPNRPKRPVKKASGNWGNNYFGRDYNKTNIWRETSSATNYQESIDNLDEITDDMYDDIILSASEEYSGASSTKMCYCSECNVLFDQEDALKVELHYICPRCQEDPNVDVSDLLGYDTYDNAAQLAEYYDYGHNVHQFIVEGGLKLLDEVLTGLFDNYDEEHDADKIYENFI